MLEIRKCYGGPSARPLMDYGAYRELAIQSQKRKDSWDPDDDEGFEFLPDHEYPWATAMFKEAFGDPEPVIMIGEMICRNPTLDVELIEFAASLDIPYGDLRDIVIYADGRCLDPVVERKRLEAAKRGSAARRR